MFMNQNRVFAICLILISFATVPVTGSETMKIPDDFPRFYVPGYERKMELLREMYWIHYRKAGPGATLWDEWMSAPALWPAVTTNNSLDNYIKRWRDALSTRIIDPEGYVATHQHASVTHPLGWPFPFWVQGDATAGWLFSYKDIAPAPYRPGKLATSEGWVLNGAADQGINEDGWHIKLTESRATVETPGNLNVIDVYQAPLVQIRWRAQGMGNVQPYIEWKTNDNREYSIERRMYFEPAGGDRLDFTMIPLYRNPKWKGKVTRMRFCFNNVKTDISVTIKGIFTNFDTRHNVNAQSFIRGCANYFWWTGDLNFLRHNINRMRKALQYVLTEHRTLDMNIVFTDWVGHEGRTGLAPQPDGANKLLYGNGIGNNYWDLLPFGYKDAYATLRFYDTLQVMEKIERETEAHPEWDIPSGILRHTPEMLAKHAELIKKKGNEIFWNTETGRFIAAEDIDGNRWDYGFTFVNLEAIHYDFASKNHADEIMQWISGERLVEGDTARGDDIYYWRFAPRSTTKRNVEYYSWVWTAPQAIPWGGQVQDGGAVLGWSYHDLMSRLKVRGADDCWQRLQEILEWFGEVQEAGGYRAYYKDIDGVTLQGGGAAGGLGLDHEFVESVLVPQIIIDGFMGFTPTGDGFEIKPKLPGDWKELTIDRIHYHGMTLKITAMSKRIEIQSGDSFVRPIKIYPPLGTWTMKLFSNGEARGESCGIKIDRKTSAVLMKNNEINRIVFEK